MDPSTSMNDFFSSQSGQDFMTAVFEKSYIETLTDKEKDEAKDLESWLGERSCGRSMRQRGPNELRVSAHVWAGHGFTRREFEQRYANKADFRVKVDANDHQDFAKMINDEAMQRQQAKGAAAPANKK